MSLISILIHLPDISYKTYMVNTSYSPYPQKGQKVKGKTARVQVIRETTDGPEGESRLCLQWCRYIYDNGNLEEGYRFIWRRPDDSLQAARGQARIPSLKAARKLMDKAVSEGWGKKECKA